MIEFKIFLDTKLIQRIVTSKGLITIGRSSDNDIVLRSEHVSRCHAVIYHEESHPLLEDKSMNGLLLNGQRVIGSTPLPPRCCLEIYPFTLECMSQQDDRTLPLPKSNDTLSCKGIAGIADFAQKTVVSYHYGTLVGESIPMQHIYRLIESVAHSQATVLVQGECGTGKELVAKAIHETSPRRQKTFLALNCAAVPLDLIESELFGYEKGSFTGAHASKKGKIEEADGGTLFLDEIGELSLAAQAKLLRFLQGKTLMRLGSAREIPVDVRVIAATNKDLKRAVHEETFRSDLYYRIHVFPIQLPSLRERLEDIPLLVAHVIKKIAHELQLSSEPWVTPAAMTQLQNAKWPGNIRQLENLLYSAALRSKAPWVLDEALLTDTSPMGMDAQESQEAPLDTVTKQVLLDVLKQTRWDTTKAAEKLKVSRGTIYYKLKKYGIDVRDASKGEAQMKL